MTSLKSNSTIKYSHRRTLSIVAFALVIGFTCIFLISLYYSNITSTSLNGVYFSEYFMHYIDTDQYARLADALIHGKTNLDLPVSNALASLANPYDFSARYSLAANGDIPAYFDHAFFNGKYYCYFGVVPAIMLYVPFKLFTGVDLSTPLAVLTLGIFFSIAAGLLIWKLSSIMFGEGFPITNAIILFITFIMGSDLIYLVFVSRTYSVPILGSLFFTTIGLWFWIKSLDFRLTPESSNAARCLPNPLFIAMGSFCMALNLGCRPQFCICWLLAFIIFRKEIFKYRTIFSKRGLLQTVTSICPFIVVIGALCWYNYIRFGSFTDFGSLYNLTGFDMTSYHQPIAVLPEIIYYYLFQPISLTSSFPFVEQTMISFSSNTAVPVEPMYGGYFFLMPLMWLLFLIPVLVIKRLVNKNELIFILPCLLFGIIVLILDGRIAGVNQRYFADFGFMFCLALIPCVASILRHSWNLQFHFNKALAVRSYFNVRNALVVILFLWITICMALWIASFFTTGHYESWYFTNPVLYNTFQSLFQ